MNPYKRYSFFRVVFKGFRKSQVKTIAWVVMAILEAGQGRLNAVGRAMARLRGMRLGSGINRVWRLLANERVDWREGWTAGLLGFFGHGRRVLLVSLDWTHWGNVMQVLAAMVVVGKRAIPVMVEAFWKEAPRWSQNVWEEHFGWQLVQAQRRAGVETVWLCDRGFHRLAWLERLIQWRQAFIVRINDDLVVWRGNVRWKRLREMGLEPGNWCDLGWVWLGTERRVRVRVIGVWDKCQKEPWWLATTLDVAAPLVVAWYDRRMTIEEAFRDTKGCRYGLQLRWSQFRTPDHLARMMLLVGLALLLATAVGQWTRQHLPRLSFFDTCYTLWRLGIESFRYGWRKIPLSARWIRRHLPDPAVRNFDWITATEKLS